jgi:branched-chain amino acid transport system ATP-binding protein
MLELTGFSAGYGRLRVIRNLRLAVARGEAVALLGPNGAGKTTLLTGIMGALRERAGSVRFAGRELGAAAPHEIVSAGLTLVPEGRHIFGPLSVEDNLRLGAIGLGRPARATVAERFELVYDLFPRLVERRRQVARTLSGGEQQMLAIGRSLMAAPRMLLLDEPFLGLAPQIVQEILASIGQLVAGGLPIVLVEQKFDLALGIAQRAYVMIKGEIVLESDTATLKRRDHLDQLYFDLARSPFSASEIPS